MALNVGGSLNEASVQDTHKSSNHSVGASVGISGNQNVLGTNGINNNGSYSSPTGANGGFNTANGSSNDKTTVLTSLTGGTVVANIKGNTDVKGALLSGGSFDNEGNFVGNNNLTLNTGSLTHSDLTNRHHDSSTSASMNIAESSSHVSYSNQSTHDKTKTLATIGGGTLTVNNQTYNDSTLNRDSANIDKEIYHVEQNKGNIDLSVDHRLLTEDGRKEIKEDVKRTNLLVESVADVATNDGVSLVANQANGETGLLDHIDEDQKYFTATKKFVNDPANKDNVATLNNPNATPREKQEAYTALANHIAEEMGVTPAQAKLMVDSQYAGAFHREGESGTIYVNDLANSNSAQAVNTVGHETQHSIDYQNDKDIVKTENYEANREDHAELMGDHTEDYMEYQYADNGYNALDATRNNNIGTNPYNGLDVTVIKNTSTFRQINPNDLDYAPPRSGSSNPVQNLRNMEAEAILSRLKGNENSSYKDGILRNSKSTVNWTPEQLEILRNEETRVSRQANSNTKDPLAEISTTRVSEEEINQQIREYEAKHNNQITYKIRDDIVPQSGSRGTGINRAWKLERELVLKTGKGTRNWTPEEIQELKNTGKVTGYTGHHRNNVNQFPEWKGDARNIDFISNQPNGGEHLNGNRGHRGNYQNPTNGRLIDREAMIKTWK